MSQKQTPHKAKALQGVKISKPDLTGTSKEETSHLPADCQQLMPTPFAPQPYLHRRYSSAAAAASTRFHDSIRAPASTRPHTRHTASIGLPAAAGIASHEKALLAHLPAQLRIPSPQGTACLGAIAETASCIVDSHSGSASRPPLDSSSLPPTLNRRPNPDSSQSSQMPNCSQVRLQTLWKFLPLDSRNSLPVPVRSRSQVPNPSPPAEPSSSALSAP
jgi:hypothetical protein